MLGQLQRFADRLHAAVHHVRRCHHLGTGLGMRQRLLDQRIDGDVVLHIAGFVEDAVLTVSGERVEGHVTDHPEFGEFRPQGADRALGDTVRVPGFRPIEGLLLQRGDREQCQRRNTQLDPMLGFLEQQVDGQTLDARHRRHGFAAVFAVEDEHRQDQIIDAQAMLTHQAAGEVITTVATQTGGREQTVGGGNAHGRLQSPHGRASVTVISGHYDQMMTTP